MYLISLYFDSKTNTKLQSYIDAVAETTGNKFMVDNHVPPHLTISAFETLNMEKLNFLLEEIMKNQRQMPVDFVSIGNFRSNVIFIQPILSRSLHELSHKLYDVLERVSETKTSNFYKPFHWIPHITMGKQLTEDEIVQAFQILNKQFEIFQGKVVRVELAKKTPFQIIKVWELN